MTALGLRPWALACVLVTATVAVTAAFDNDEYGLSAAIPAGLPECIANTQGHVHGVGTVLVGRDCDDDTPRPAFNIWADYNTAEYPNALSMLRAFKCVGARWADDEWKGAISGLRTAVCRVQRANGDVELTLTAQAWRWPGDTYPYMNYTVNFGSTKSRVDRDLQVLRRFLRSVKIVKPEALRAESPKPGA